MAEWIYFIHSPRSNFAETMAPEEKAVWSAHFDHFQRLPNEGVIILVGPTLGETNTGIAIFEAPDEDAARRSWRRTRPSRAASHAVSSGPFASRCSAVGTSDSGKAIPSALAWRSQPLSDWTSRRSDENLKWADQTAAAPGAPLDPERLAANVENP